MTKWKKHLKEVSELRERNRELDMETAQRLDEMLADIKDTGKAVSLEFLKEYLRLRPDNDDAMQELKMKLQMKDDVTHRVIIDDTDQTVYVAFNTPTRE
ncbi:MAG: hypothetical protein KGY80_09310 [Candidatus Thorarchaeota archaeon]|nr:hypothetical protein [Candidatus Thorarchaeota archaeon]